MPQQDQNGQSCCGFSDIRGRHLLKMNLSQKCDVFLLLHFLTVLIYGATVNKKEPVRLNAGRGEIWIKQKW